MKQNKETLKEHFETGDKPTQQQFADLIDSYVDSKQSNGEANRRFVIDEMGEVSITSEKIAPVYTLSDIVANKLSLLKDGEVVKEIDLTTYVDDTNLSRLVSGVYNATTKSATFTRDDNTTFDLDLSSLGLGLTFADEEGNVKYSSSIDKRTGYYDVINKVYYPDIIEVQANKKYRIQQPVDSHFFVSTNNIAIKLPSNIGVISFDIDIYNRTGIANQEESVKVHIKGEIQNNTWITYNNPSVNAIKQNYNYNFHFCRKNGEFYVFVESLNSNISLVECYVSNLFVYNRFLSLTNPLDWYSGWNFDISNLSTYIIDYTISNVDSIPVGKIDIYDSVGALQDATNEIHIGENLKYNKTTKTLDQVYLPAIVNIGNKFLRYGEDPTSIGANAFHLAFNSIGAGATGQFSFTTGFNAQAGGRGAIAMGESVNALRKNSVVIASSSEAYADYAVSLAVGGKPYAFGSIYVGCYPTVDITQNKDIVDLNNVALKVGAGTDSSNRKDCLTVFKNGAVKYEPVIISTIIAPEEGMIAFNDATKKHQGYDGTQWNDLY
ncbi:hypothetical protein [Tenacibaculum ovolyticum]|uniref:hypothetical protein n=1 Tax=Tenacibaculum ovolyticum TaxID=104270 RepID=UPI000413367F|nr:hypothetical protein [Tenacibaculum ovolyticum]